MNAFMQIRALVGETVTEEELKYVDCYVHDKIGVFIPSMGACQYAARPNHTHPTYMFVIYFSRDFSEVGIEIKENHYLGTVTSPEVPHQDEEDQSYYCILIEKNYFEMQYKMYAKQVPKFEITPFLVCQDMLKALNLFIFEVSKKMQNAEVTLSAQTTILTHWLIRSILGENYDMRPIASHYAVARAQHYIEEHYSEKIIVEQLARFVNMSESHFNRIFKKEMHLTPLEYIIETRIEQAKKLLRRKEVSITDIAIRCGFNSSAHFSSKFSTLVGVTPSEYRHTYCWEK